MNGQWGGGDFLLATCHWPLTTSLREMSDECASRSYSTEG